MTRGMAAPTSVPNTRTRMSRVATWMAMKAAGFAYATYIRSKVGGVVEDLAQLGQRERAKELLVLARRAAERHAHATLVDIELLEQRLLLQDD